MKDRCLMCYSRSGTVYTLLRHNIMTTCLIFCWFPFDANKPWLFKAWTSLAADPLSPVSYEVGSPWIRHVCPADLGNLEARSRPQIRCAPQTITEPFLLCGTAHYPAERSHSHQGIPFPWKGVHGLQQCFVGGTCQSNIHMDGRTQGFPADHCPNITLPPPAFHLPIVHLGAMCFPDEQHTRTQPSMWCKRKHDSSDQATFFHFSVVQILCSRAHCWYFRLWTGVSMGTLTGLQLCSPICNKLRCTVYPDTFLSEPASTSSAIWARVPLLLDQTTQASLRSPHASMSLATHDLVAGLPLFRPWTTFDSDSILKLLSIEPCNVSILGNK